LVEPISPRVNYRSGHWQAGEQIQDRLADMTGAEQHHIGLPKTQGFKQQGHSAPTTLCCCSGEGVMFDLLLRTQLTIQQAARTLDGQLLELATTDSVVHPVCGHHHLLAALPWRRTGHGENCYQHMGLALGMSIT
jgi:hypothetical protein